MMFYKKCLGGELMMQTIGESPMAGSLPLKMKNCILHSTLTNDSLVLIATDCVPENGLKKGNAVSLLLNCKSETQIKKLYKKLADGGMATQPLSATFWGALFGGLTDKFGNHWLLNYQTKK